MGKNGYLERQKKAIGVYRQAEKETYMQYMVDMFMIVLNDPEVMGKDVLGKKRLAKVVSAVSKTYDEYVLALTSSSEADYWQTKLDERLASIIGQKDLIPFKERYEWIAQCGYNPRGK